MKIPFIAAVITAVAMTSAADASVTVNISQVGNNVIETVSGTLDIAGLSTPALFPSTEVPAIGANYAYIGAGVYNSLVTDYSGITGPTELGTGALTAATSSTGLGFSLNSGTDVFLPKGYVSGAVLSDQAIFAETTLASLGLTLGDFVYAAPNDTIAINIGSAAAAVPEPATWIMMLLGFGLLAGMMRKARKTSLVPA